MSEKREHAPRRAPRKVEEPLSFFPIRTLWTLALNTQLTAPAAFDQRRAYFALSGDQLACYELTTGTQLWLVASRTQMQPAIGDDLIFSVEPELLVARRTVDGSVAWQLPMADALAVPPVYDNGWLVIATSSGSILAVRAADGHVIWRREVGSPAHAAPALAADRIYIPTDDGRVMAVQVEDGMSVWEQRLGGAVSDVLVLDDRLYAGSKNQFLYCLTTKDGRIDWRWRTGGAVVGVPTADERNVYFVALDNTLRALDRTSGGQRWMRPLPLRPLWGPVKVGTAVVVAGQASIARAFKITDGTPAGELAAEGELAIAPHLVEDPQATLPQLLIVTRDIAKGATVRLVTHTFDPQSSLLTEPLPNVIKMSSASGAQP